MASYSLKLFFIKNCDQTAADEDMVLWPVYTIKETRSKHEANLQHTSCTCIL